MQKIGFFWALTVVAIAFTPLCGYSVTRADSETVFHVYFKFNSAGIEAKEAAALKKFANRFQLSGTNYEIHISGYCDAVGTNVFNDKLSMKRIKSVKKELINFGIGSGAIKEMNAYGKRKPLNANKTAAERQANRRVDIEIIINKNRPPIGLSFLKNGGKAGMHIILKDLDFVGGMHDLLPDFLPELDSLVMIMKSNPTLDIKIVGHVCCTPDGMDGLDLETMTNGLSINRAKAIYDYLIQHHISKTRLSYMGKGGSNKLVEPEITEQDKSLNRRVEVVIVKE